MHEAANRTMKSPCISYIESTVSGEHLAQEFTTILVKRTSHSLNWSSKAHQRHKIVGIGV